MEGSEDQIASGLESQVKKGAQDTAGRVPLKEGRAQVWRTRMVRRIALAVVEPGPMQRWRWEKALGSPGHWDRRDLEDLEPGGFGAASAVRAPRRCGQRLWELGSGGTEPFSQGEAVNRHVESGVLFCFFCCEGGGYPPQWISEEITRGDCQGLCRCRRGSVWKV